MQPVRSSTASSVCMCMTTDLVRTQDQVDPTIAIDQVRIALHLSIEQAVAMVTASVVAVVDTMLMQTDRVPVTWVVQVMLSVHTTLPTILLPLVLVHVVVHSVYDCDTDRQQMHQTE